MVSFPFHFTYKEEKKFTTKNLAQQGIYIRSDIFVTVM